MSVHGFDNTTDDNVPSKPFPQAWSGTGRVLNSGERVQGNQLIIIFFLNSAIILIRSSNNG